MFANRFTALHPERVMAAAVGSPGGWPIAPQNVVEGTALPYPIGIADLKELIGRDFDAERFRAVPQLFVMGALDENDSVDYRDGYSEPEAVLTDRLFGTTPVARWGHAETLYRTAGVRARFTLVEGVGHDRKALQELSTRFFAEILGS